MKSEKYYMISHTRNLKKIIQMNLFTKQTDFKNKLTVNKGDKLGDVDWGYGIGLCIPLYME